ncbi:MAG: hypothetical protein ACXV2I_08555 [Actinomycetes bacterium]
MNRRLALVALWAVFAAASVGVGFGAAGLVGDPFTSAASPAINDALSAATPSDRTSPAPSAGATATSPAPRLSGSGGGSGSKPGATSSGSASGGSGGSSGRGGSGGSVSGGTGGTGGSSSVTRNIQTRGGSVFATCRGGLVKLSVAPAVGWQIDEVDGGRVTRARVRFEQSHRDGRVEVQSWCSGGTPRFAQRDDSSGSGGGGGGDGGGVDD